MALLSSFSEFVLGRFSTRDSFPHEFFPRNTIHEQQFGLHYSHGNSAFPRYEPRMLPATSDGTLIRTQTASSPVILLLLPTGAILLPRLLSWLRPLSHTLVCTKYPLECGFGLRCCHLCMLNYKSHSAVLVFLYDVLCCVRD